MSDLSRFVDKYHLALQTAQAEKPANGLCGLELEWNMLDSQMRPLLTVGSGPGQMSFVDSLRADFIPPKLREFSQLEVFHWMIEWATRPYYSPRGAIYESRLLEAVLINALDAAGRSFGDQLHLWPGNLLYSTEVGPQSIPFSWHIAKRRYLERCVALYGSQLATAGNHANLSLPEPLFTWDFVHLPASERGSQHLDEYKSEFYITATRLLRAFASLFIACSAATPLKGEVRRGVPVIVLTEWDSVRNLTFPNPSVVDLADLYRSYRDYLQNSYELVRSGVRFGNNNWTPIRARSYAEPVERLILVTSEQLHDLYARGLYSAGSSQPVEDMARQIEMQNLMARINLPMSRVEVRTDDGGHSLEEDVANLTLKHLLVLRFYADEQFTRSFRYDREDLQRARRAEEKASRFGLEAEIENLLTGKSVRMREYLAWVLTEVQPLAEALDLWQDLEPLKEMAAGAPNQANQLRQRLTKEMGVRDEVPLELMTQLVCDRINQVKQEISWIVRNNATLDYEPGKLRELIQIARDSVQQIPDAPVTFNGSPTPYIEVADGDKTREILALAQSLIAIPSVTACSDERLLDIRKISVQIYDYLKQKNLELRYFGEAKYPAILAGYPGKLYAPVMLAGHFDVVAPEPDDSQFSARVDGDYLWGRGSADMKTVVATWLVWMKDRLRQGPPYPPINLLLIGNEENGEAEPMGTPHVLHILQSEKNYQPSLFIAGERTGEKGNEHWGEICPENRGVARFDLVLRGIKAHSGIRNIQPDLTERLFSIRDGLNILFGQYLTLKSTDGWQSQARFPFMQVGTPGVYNLTPDMGLLGVEVRPIPQDNLSELMQAIQELGNQHQAEVVIKVMENGIICDPANQYLNLLIRAVEECSGQSARIGKKLPGTSARFAPGGQGVIWGQSGIGPHAKEERHYIPSIEPYYQALQRFSELL
jgi:succinyl-diaminopimelate desuccinylase